MLDTSNGSCIATGRTSIVQKSVVLKTRSNETNQSRLQFNLCRAEVQDSEAAIPDPEWRQQAESILYRHFEDFAPSSSKGKKTLKLAVRLALDEIIDLIEEVE